MDRRDLIENMLKQILNNLSGVYAVKDECYYFDSVISRDVEYIIENVYNFKFSDMHIEIKKCIREVEAARYFTMNDEINRGWYEGILGRFELTEGVIYEGMLDDCTFSRGDAK